VTGASCVRKREGERKQEAAVGDRLPPDRRWKDLKSVGIDVKLNQKEHGAFISSTAVGNYEGIYYGPATPFLDPDSYLYTSFYPGHPRNIGKVNDPVAHRSLGAPASSPGIPPDAGR